MLDWLKWVVLGGIMIVMTFIVAQGFGVHRANLIDSQNTAIHSVSSVLNQFSKRTDLQADIFVEELIFELSKEITQGYDVELAYDFFYEDGSHCDENCQQVQFRVDLKNEKEIVSSMHKRFSLNVKEDGNGE
ncbi:MAG: hypothetical protein ACRC5Q_01025 [Culicoidibacterales bacterium]